MVERLSVPDIRALPFQNLKKKNLINNSISSKAVQDQDSSKQLKLKIVSKCEHVWVVVAA